MAARQCSAACCSILMGLVLLTIAESVSALVPVSASTGGAQARARETWRKVTAGSTIFDVMGLRDSTVPPVSRLIPVDDSTGNCSLFDQKNPSTCLNAQLCCATCQNDLQKTGLCQDSKLCDQVDTCFKAKACIGMVDSRWNNGTACDPDDFSFCGDFQISLIKYFTFFYCDSQSRIARVVIGIFLIVWLLIIFSLLASTADNFFVPVLEVLSAQLKLSPAVAGVTLLALGNSSPDVFTDLAAVQGQDDFAMAIGELMGASMFLTTVVLSAVIWVSTSDGKQCQVDKVPFIRDVTIFSIAVLFVLVLSATEHAITLYEAIALVCVYLAYIAIVVFGSYMFEDKKVFHRQRSMFEEKSKPLVEVATPPAEDADSDRPTIVGLEWDPTAGWLVKAQFIAEYPFSWARWCSIPSPSTEIWNRPRRLLASVSPVGALCILFISFSGDWNNLDGWHGFVEPTIGSSFPMFWLVCLCMMLVSIAIYFGSTDDALPRFHIALVGIAFISCVSWLNVIGNECASMLEALGMFTGISKTKSGHSIIGVTVLAWANSIGDLVADTAVARAGQPKMGVASVFGSPLLTCCLGLGISCVIATISQKDHKVSTNLNSEIVLSFIFVFVSLFSSLIVISCNGFVLPRRYAYFLIGLYCLYVVLTLVVQAGWHFCVEPLCPGGH